MKKFLFMLCAVLILGGATAQGVEKKTSEADGARSMWAG